MPQFCSYHPLSHAKWECRECETKFDKQCVPEANERERRGQCPRCNAPLYYISETEIQPYWKINAHFFRNALKSPLFIFALVIVSMQFFLRLDAQSSYILNGTLLAITLCYGWYSLKMAFKGELKLPRLDQISANPDINLVFGPSILVAAFGSIIFGAYYLLGGLGATVVSIIASIVLPATFIVLGHESDLPSSVQPSKLIPVGIFLGSSYLGLSLYLLLALLCSLVAADFAHQHLYPGLALPSGVGVGCYFVIALMQMFGYAGHQYKHNLMHKATLTARPRGNPDAFNDRSMRIDADITINAIDGNYAKITEILESYIKKRSHDQNRKAQLYSLLNALDDQKRLEQHAHSFIRMLLIKGRETEAARFIDARRRHNAEFRLHDAQLSYEMAHAAARNHDYKLVIWLGKDAHIRLDDPEYVPRMYYVLAETLLKHYKKPDKAKSYLSFVIKNYPEHEVLGKALPLMQSIQSKLN